MIDWLNHIDTQLFLFFNSFHNKSWDWIMWHISGKPEWLPLYLFLIFVIIRKYRKQSIWLLLSIAVLVTLSDTISAKIIKELVARPRPSHNPDIANMIHLVKNHHGGLYGFVSNHAANTFALATYLALNFKNKWASAALLFWASLVSYSRIYIGVHYPGDIVGGAILGILLAIIIYKLYQLFYRQKITKTE